MEQRKIEAPAKGERITASFLRELSDWLVHRITLVGGKVSRVGNSIILEPDRTIGSSTDKSFWAQITVCTAVGSFTRTVDSVEHTYYYRWDYTFEEVEKTSTGYGGWAEKSGGITGTAYNMTEVPNSSSGVQGNGITYPLSDDAAGFTMKPAPTGIIVRVWPVTVGSTTEYWFSYENGVDGSCT